MLCIIETIFELQIAAASTNNNGRLILGVAAESRLRLARVGLLGSGVLHALLMPSFDLAPVKDFFRLNLTREKFQN